MNTREGFVGGFTRLFCSCFENIVNRGDVLFPFRAFGADWAEGFLEHVNQELFAGSVAQAAAAVVLLHLVKVFVLGQIFGKVIVRAQRVKIGENNVALGVTGILDSQVGGIGEHFAVDLLFDCLCGVGKIDAVAERFAHFCLAVNAGQAPLGFVFGNHSLWKHQRFAVKTVEFLDNLARLLNHRELIVADRDNGGVKSRDVRRLRNRIREEAHGQSFVGKAAHLNFRLDGWVARKARGGYHIHIVKRQRVQSGQSRLDADCCFFGVDTHRKVVEHNVDDVVADFVGVVGVVGQRLVVGDKNVNLVELSRILKLNAPFERADVMSEVEPSCRAVACQNDLLLFFIHWGKSFLSLIIAV